MPEISRFFGINIKMFFGDHSPPHYQDELLELWEMAAKNQPLHRIDPLQ